MATPSPVLPPMTLFEEQPAVDATDGVVDGVGDRDAIAAIAQPRTGAGDIGADVIALDDVVRSRARVEVDAIQTVAADDVAGAHRRAANGIGALVDMNNHTVGDVLKSATVPIARSVPTRVALDTISGCRIGAEA